MPCSPLPSLLALLSVLLCLAGCGDQATSPTPTPATKASDAPVPLGAEAAAFYWFRSQAISDAGHALYGRFVHERLLPELAPAAQRDPAAWFITFDGDCMSQASGFESYFRPEDAALLQEADRIGASLCYVVAVFGQGTRSFAEIDGRMKRDGTLGYMGMTVPRELDRETLLRARGIMALVVATRIDGARFKKIGYAFHADEELQRMGFEPYAEK